MVNLKVAWTFSTGVNRGAAYSNSKIFFNTLDGQTCAVEAATDSVTTTIKAGDGPWGVAIRSL